MLGHLAEDVAPMGIDWRVDSIAENEGYAVLMVDVQAVEDDALGLGRLVLSLMVMACSGWRKWSACYRSGGFAGQRIEERRGSWYAGVGLATVHDLVGFSV